MWLFFALSFYLDLLYMTCVTNYNVTTKNINAPMNMEIFKIKTASA